MNSIESFMNNVKSVFKSEPSKVVLTVEQVPEPKVESESVDEMFKRIAGEQETPAPVMKLDAPGVFDPAVPIVEQPTYSNTGYSPAFITAINRILKSEGGYVNDPRDPGGETNFGISKRAAPTVDIKNLTRDKAIAWYHQNVWQAVGGDDIPRPVAYQIIDFAVNGGNTTAVHKYQMALGVADDGHFGPVSVEAAKKMSATDQILAFNAVVIRYYTKLSKFSIYGAGWMNRIADHLMYGAEDT